MREPAGFESSRRKAESISGDLKKTTEIINRALIKSQKQKGKLDKVLNEIDLLINMIKAWTRGEYRTIPLKTIITGLAALVYLVNPFDMVPDFLLGLGLIDDVTVISFVFNSIRKDIEQFTQWQLEQAEQSYEVKEGN
ncbi:YkvA family protein [Phosphitispora sp. TUW77]|uniref:YkvA family protein n=1 Tax=Phosphitispora sp. TUW77 TaxID=3152361 RepID=UPI003AB67C7B